LKQSNSAYRKSKEKKHFDKLGVNYDVSTGNVDRHIVKEMQSKIFDEIDLDDVILEIGCGTGIHTIKVSENVSEIIGVDLSTGMLKAFKRKMKTNDKISVVLADAEKLPFRSNTFDVIYFVGTLHHIAGASGTIKHAINEATRAAKSKGKILAIEPNADNLYLSLRFRLFTAQKNSMYERPCRISELIEAFRSNNLRIIKLYTIGAIPRFTPEKFLPFARFLERALENMDICRFNLGFICISSIKDRC